MVERQAAVGTFVRLVVATLPLLCHGLDTGGRRGLRDIQTPKDFGREVIHTKKPGGGYVKDPLYEKQKGLNRAGEAAPGKKAAQLPGDGTAPSLAVTLVVVWMCAVGASYLLSHMVPKQMSKFHEFLGHPATFRLLVVPTLTALTTIMMTYMNYEAFKTPQEDRFYLVSQTINFPTTEAWSSWVARWALWHLSIFSIVEYKCMILPPRLRWLPMVWGLSLCLVLWSGFHQFDTKSTYCCDAFGYKPWQRLGTHITFAYVAFAMCWFESVCLWWPTKTVHICYAFLFFSFPMACTFIGMHGPIPSLLEFTVIGANIFIVWLKVDEVSDAIKRDTWRPWVGCNHWCCPGLKVEQGGSCCCPRRK